MEGTGVVSKLEFPESPRVRFERNPLVEVVCQLRFPTILRISENAPAEFQELIRESYPRYRLGPSLEAPGDLPPEVLRILAKQLSVSSAPVHRFQSEGERPRTVSLSQDFIALSETDYTDWENFRHELDVILGRFVEIYRPAPFVRIGLRYINRIDWAGLELGDLPWQELIEPSFVGLPGSPGVGAHLEESLTQALLRIPQVPESRVRILHGLQRDPATSMPAYLVDSDFFTTERRSKNVSTVLDVFNHLAGNLFRSALKPRLFEALRPTVLQPTGDRPGDASAGAVAN